MRMKPVASLAAPMLAVAALGSCSDDSDPNEDVPGTTVELELEGSIPPDGTLDIEVTTPGS